MAFQLVPSIAVLLTLIVFFLCLLTFAGVPHTDLPQDNSRWLKYPAWHPPLKGARWTANPPTLPKLQSVFVSETENGTKKISAYGFNRLLVLYSFITMLTLSSILIFDIGKFWVALGILHNASEFSVLVLIGSGGKIRSNLFWGILCCYWFFVYIGSLLIEWPYDAVWFKFQGLCFDYALMFTFIRIYINTNQKLKNYNHEHVPLNRDD
ncbi:12914_t:CDS:2, partial [Cetraspora pellucida]